MFGKKWIVGLGAVVVLVGREQVESAIISFDFTGHVTEVGSSWNGTGVAVNDSVLGEFTYDTTISDRSPGDPAYGGYIHDPPFAPNGLTIQTGEYTFVADASKNFLVNVYNDYGDYKDTLAFGWGGFVEPVKVGGPALPFGLDNMALSFWDSSGTAFSSDALPTSLDLADFDRFLDRMGWVTLQSGDPWNHRFYFDLDTLSLGTPSGGGGGGGGGGAVIPEPSTFVIWSLLATLGITVGWWRRRRYGLSRG